MTWITGATHIDLITSATRVDLDQELHERGLDVDPRLARGGRYLTLVRASLIAVAVASTSGITLA